MKFHTIIEEDSITPYLENIKFRLNASEEELIYKIGSKFAEEGQSRVPFWHGNLEDSVSDPDLWRLFDEGDFLKLDIIFTGLADDVDEWWWEFKNPHFPKGGRDYALFQETGVDWYADSKHAKHKGYVRKSTAPTQKFADKYLAGEIRRIMKAQG